MKAKMIIGGLEAFAIVLLLAISMIFIVPSATATPVPGALVADNPGVTVQGTGEDFMGSAWWVRGGSTSVTFTFNGINTAGIYGVLEVRFNLGVTNHLDGEEGLDGLVDITINPGVVGWTYTLPNVLFDNIDDTNHVYAMGGLGSYATEKSILVKKDYIQAGTLVIRVTRHVDTKDYLPIAPICTNCPIDMNTAPPTVPAGCYDNNDAHTVHIYVDTDDSGTVAASGQVTIYQKGLPNAGIDVPIDKLALLAPYIGGASTIVLAVIASVASMVYIKRRKEKQ